MAACRCRSFCEGARRAALRPRAARARLAHGDRFWLRPNIASYNGLRLLLNLSPVLVFTALAQMFVMTASDIDLGIGAFVGLVDRIVAGLLNDHKVFACIMLRPVRSAMPAWARSFI